MQMQSPSIALEAVTIVTGKPRLPIAERRARLVVRCAADLLGLPDESLQGELQVPLSVNEFADALRARYGVAHPELVFRTDSTLERARLDRRSMPDVPRVILRQGAPRRSSRRQGDT